MASNHHSSFIHSGVTPTVLTSGYLGELEDKATVQRNPTMYHSSHLSQPTAEVISPPPNASVTMATRPPCSQRGSNGDSVLSQVSVAVPNRLSQSEFSGGSTVETIMSPSDPGVPVVMEIVPNKTNLNQVNAKANRPLQPHQGQNPTRARNTHKRSDEELTIIGNNLVDKSAMGGGIQPADKARGLSNVTLADELLDVLADNLESSLVQNDMLNQQLQHTQQHQQQQHPQQQQRPNQSQHLSYSAPIPYLQNHVHNSQSNIVRPKKPNVPGNGSAYSDDPGPAPRAKAHYGSVGNKSKKNTPKSDSKPGGFMRSLFGKNFLSKGKTSKEDAAVTEPLTLHNTVDVTIPPMQSYSNLARSGKSNLNAPMPVPPLPSEVRLVNGLPVVRPANLPVQGGRGQRQQQPSYNVDAVTVPVPVPQNRLGVAEVGVAKLENNPTTAGQPAMVQVKNKSLSSVDLSPNSGWSSNFADSDTDSDPRARRPCSLSLTGHNYTSASAGSLPQTVKGSLDKYRKGSKKDPQQPTSVQMELLRNLNTGEHNIAVKPPNVSVDQSSRHNHLGEGTSGHGGAKRAGQPMAISLQQLRNGHNGNLQLNDAQAADCRC